MDDAGGDRRRMQVHVWPGRRPRGRSGCSTQVAIAAISATAAILSVRRVREGEANISGYTTDAKMATSVRTGKPRR